MGHANSSKSQVQKDEGCEFQPLTCARAAKAKHKPAQVSRAGLSSVAICAARLHGEVHETLQGQMLISHCKATVIACQAAVRLDLQREKARAAAADVDFIAPFGPYRLQARLYDICVS